MYCFKLEAINIFHGTRYVLCYHFIKVQSWNKTLAAESLAESILVSYHWNIAASIFWLNLSQSRTFETLPPAFFGWTYLSLVPLKHCRQHFLAESISASYLWNIAGSLSQSRTFAGSIFVDNLSGTTVMTHMFG